MSAKIKTLLRKSALCTFATVFIALTAFSPAMAQQQKTPVPPVQNAAVTLITDSTPDSAEVYINLELRCTTPCKLRDLKPNKAYKIEVRKKGYITQTFVKTWAQGGEYTINAGLVAGENPPQDDSSSEGETTAPPPPGEEPQTPVLVIYSEPAGADVYLDLEPRCSTPCKIPDLETSKQYRVDVRDRGYISKVINRQWDEPGEYTINVTLEKEGEDSEVTTTDDTEQVDSGAKKRQPSDMNVCKGNRVEDLWTKEAVTRHWLIGWHNAGSMQSLTDGDFASGVSSGYGTWGDEGDGMSYDVQSALGRADALDGQGLPCILVDLDEKRAIDRLVIGRPLQEPEGGGGLPVMTVSTWGSADGASWHPLAKPFVLTPADRKEILVDLKPDDPQEIRYIRLNLHSLGMYKKSRKPESQIGFTEIQCFE